MVKKKEDLRSARWFEPDDLRSMGHRSRAMQMGLDQADWDCLLYTSPSPRDRQKSRMPSSA